MKLVFVNIMPDLHRLDTTATISQPPVPLQYWALKLTGELNRMTGGIVAHALRVGRRGRGLKFATTLPAARRRIAQQAPTLLDRVEQAMAAKVEMPLEKEAHP